MKKRFTFFIMLLMGLGIFMWINPMSVAAKVTLVSDSPTDESSANIRNYVATGSNALYDLPGVLPEAKQIASASTIASYKPSSGEGLFRAYRYAKTSNGNYYMKVTSFDDAYDGWIYVGKTNPSADWTKVGGGLKNIATTRDSNLTDQEKTGSYMFKQVGTVDDGTMLTYKAPKWTQYQLGAQITDSTPYASDRLVVSKAAIRTREGDRWVYIQDADHPEASGWILDSALAAIGRVTINYQDESGQKIAATKVITGKIGDNYKTQEISIPGYTYVSVDGEKSGKISSENDAVTYHYKKDVAPTGTTTGTPAETPTETPAETPQETPIETPAETPTSTVTNATTANRRVVKGQAIYAIRTVGLYHSPQFSKQQRIKSYPKAKRINRPEFVVKGYNKDKAGHLRFRVQQYNPYTKRYVKGTKGYLTASSRYVVPAYYATKPKNNKIRVINPSGIYEYNNYSLTGKQGRLAKVGTTLKVTQVRKYKYTTRYRLTNGKFITANKKFVIFGS